MPQMVALYNGVGGGAVALIAWSELRHGLDLGESFPLDSFIPILLAVVIGSISFWGSIIAFAKLQDLIPTRPVSLPGQHILNAVLLAGIVAACVVMAIDHDSPSQGHLHRRVDRRAGCSATSSCCRSGAPTCRS